MVHLFDLYITYMLTLIWPEALTFQSQHNKFIFTQFVAMFLATTVKQKHFSVSIHHRY